MKAQVLTLDFILQAARGHWKLSSPKWTDYKINRAGTLISFATDVLQPPKTVPCTELALTK